MCAHTPFLVCGYLCVCYLFTYLSTYLSTHASNIHLYVPLSRSIYVCKCSYVTIDLSICLSAHLYIYIYTRVCTCLSIYITAVKSGCSSGSCAGTSGATSGTGCGGGLLGWVQALTFEFKGSGVLGLRFRNLWLQGLGFRGLRGRKAFGSAFRRLSHKDP